MRRLSGIQPSGELHLGNYFGAIKQHIAAQAEGETFYFIANFHALTSLRDRDRLLEMTRDVAVTYLALGLDPARSTLFRQSDVPEVCELTWIFSAVTGMGLMERAVSYKDKLARGLAANVGLFTYPILQAADILIYRPDIVPVGADQVQHIEICNDIAGSFNAAFGREFFKPVQVELSEGAKVPGIDGDKMSKSYDNTIPIFLEGKPLKKRLGKIVTDSTDFTAAPLNPETCNVFALLKLFCGAEEQAELRQLYVDDRGFGYGHAKERLKLKMDEAFGEARERRRKLLENPAQVEDVLQEGARRARSIARETMAEVRDIAGIPPLAP